MSMSAKPTNKAQMRGYKTLQVLFGHEVLGIGVAEVANQLNSTNSQAYKDLCVLEEAGFAEQLPTKNWRIAPSFGREAVKILNALDSARRRVDEAASRYGVDL